MMGAGANIYNAFKAEGGEIKSYAKGGIASYSAGDRIKSSLYKMSPDELEEVAKNTSSGIVRDDAKRIEKLKELGLAKAGGGIIAFADGKTVRGMTAEDYQIKDSEELKARREADIAAALALKAEQDAKPQSYEIVPNKSPVAQGISNIIKDELNYAYSPLAEPPILKGITSVKKDTAAAPVATPVADTSVRNDLGETPEEQKRLKKIGRAHV